MKKIPGFYALFTAILMALSATSYAADGTKYFCLKEIKDQYDYPVQLEFRQVESGDADEACFEYWFDETKSNPANSTDPMPDAYRFIQHWLGMYMNPVVLKSDIAFAGHNSDGCIDSHDAFKGKYLELSEGRGLWSESGKNYTISGLCYASNQANEGIGFVSITNGSSSGISNVKFSDVYFEMTGSGSHAGVVYLDYEYYPNSFDGIDIEDSYFEADYAGALVGYTLNYYGDIENVTVKNVTINSDYHAGAVTGYIEGGFVTLKNVAVTESKVESETNAGGLVGFTDGSIAITKSYYQGSVSSKSIAGGIVGLISGGGTVKIDNTFSNGHITSGAIQGASAAGYIVGSIDTPFNYSSNVTLYNNFHFGDDMVEKGVGGDRFYADGLVWSEGYSYGNANIYANVRNATGTLTATGPLNYYMNENYDCSAGCGYVSGNYVDFFAGELGQPLTRNANGVAAEADMTSGLFAALLNYNLEADGDAALWVSNAENDGLPTFVGTSDKPNHLVVVQIKDLSSEQKATLGLVDNYTRFVTDLNSQNYYTEVMASGFSTYTEANGKLNSNGVDKIEAVKEAVAANANLNKDFVSFVDAAGNPVSLTDEISSSLICETPVAYDIVYRYCDGDPSLGTSNCANIDNIVDKTFIFMAPRVNRLFSNASLKKIVIPMVFELGKSTGLQYDVAFLDEYDYSITVGTPITLTSNMAYWLAYEVINDSYSRAEDVKKIVLTYYPSTYSITANSSINIEVQNPEAVKFTLEMSGDAADGSSHEIVGAVSSVNQNTLTPGNISVPLTRYLKVKDIECNTGYTCDGTYSISFRATKQVVCADGESPAETEVDYSATADEILAGVSGDCSASTWHVDGLKSKHGSEDGDEIDLTNSLIAREMDHGITAAFLTVTPNFVAGPFYVTYDLNTNADKKYLYFPVDAKESEKLEFSKAVHSVSLWQPYNANLMCFDGWSVTDPLVNTPQDKYKDFSEANAIQENLSMDPDAPTTLYANWSTCVDAPATKITIANGNTKATLNLKQTFDGVVYEHMLDDQNIVLAGGIYEFTIDDENSAVSFGYAKGDITASVEVTNNDGSVSTPEDITLSGNVVVISTQNDNQQKPSQNTVYSLKMESAAVPLNLVFNVNTEDMVFYGNDWKKAAYDVYVNGAENPLPQHIATFGKCFHGWSTIFNGRDAYTSLSDDAFLMMLEQASPEEETVVDEDHGTTSTRQVYKLYAIWDAACTPPATYTVSTDVDEEEGIFKIYQVVDKETNSRVVKKGTSIEQLKSDDYEFYVEFVPGVMYHKTNTFEMTAVYTNGTSSTPVETETITNPYVFNTLSTKPVGATMVSLTASGYEENVYNLFFSENVDFDDGIKVFYSDDWVSKATLDMAVNPSYTFPHLYRKDKCQDGFAFSETATKGYKNATSAEFVKEYNAYMENNPYDESVTLYAVWRDCGKEQPTYKITSADADKGTLVLWQPHRTKLAEIDWNLYAGDMEQMLVSWDMNAFAVDAKDGLEIPAYDDISFRLYFYMTEDAEYDYKLDTANVPFAYRASATDAWSTVQNDVITPNANVIIKAPMLKGKYFFVYNDNTDANVFYTSFAIAGRKGNFVSYLYGGDLRNYEYYGRTDACISGWTLSADDSQNIYERVDYSLLKLLESSGYTDEVQVYAVWDESCTQEKFTVASKMDDYGVFKVYYVMKDEEDTVWFDVGKDGLEIPTFTREIGFKFVPSEGFSVNDSIYGVDVDGDTLMRIAEDEMFNIEPGQKDFWLSVATGISSVRVALDENSKDSVFFGSDWTEELTSDNPDSAMVLPTIVYNAEKCLAGWTTDPESDELLTVIDKDLLSKLRAKGRSQGVDVRELLYAKWTTNLDSCAGAFMKLAVEQENGSIWFAEGDKDKTIERRFTEEGTMFVPMELNGRNFRVRAMGADTSVYVLDSLVVMRDGNVDTVLHVGDYMPEILDNVTLKAYFGWKNKTKLDFARARLDSTGSMFKLSFTASDFEVRRKVSAKVQVVDIVKDSIVTQSVFGDSIAMGFDTTFVFRMKKPGNYRMVVTLEDKTGVKEKFSREISVDPVISSIAADSWQMLSLSAVDMSAVTWDGDQVFYWWDEYGTGEFWQYKQLTKNDSLDATRGVWYNSLEGRPLPLRDEIDDEGEDFVWELDKANSGWNMVANPHGWAVNLFANYPDAAKDIDENPDVLFWSWNTTTGQYDPMFEEIGPYEAVWVQVPQNTKWKVSAAPAFKGESKAVEKSRSLAKSKTKDHWTLQAKLLDKNGKQDSWNILGAGLNSLTTEEPPESMADHVNLSIVDGKRALAKSIKEASDEMEWTIALSASSDRIGYLSFDGVDGVNAYGYHVFVTVDGNTTEMQNGVPLKVYLKSMAKTATVRVAPADRVVAQNTLKGLRMARLGNQLRVSFEASEGLAGTNARVDILDMKGHVMSTVTAKTLDGSNALVLDAPQTGLYMLRVRAGSEQQAKKIVVK